MSESFQKDFHEERNSKSRQIGQLFQSHARIVVVYPTDIVVCQTIQRTLHCVCHVTNLSGFVERSPLNAQENPLSQEHPLSLGDRWYRCRTLSNA